MLVTLLQMNALFNLFSLIQLIYLPIVIEIFLNLVCRKDIVLFYGLFYELL